MKRSKIIFIVAAVAVVIASESLCFGFFSKLVRKADTVEGLVVDQDGKPIPNARLFFKESEYVQIIPLVYGAHQYVSEKRTVQTDNTGNFQVPFWRDNLSLITIEQKGYVFEPCVTPKSWSRQNGPHRKEKFLMYDVSNVDTSATIIASSPEFNFDINGTDYYLDLTTGKISSTLTTNADLVFTVKQTAGMTCLATIRALGGGVLASANEMPYAPEEGYVPGFSTFYSQGYAISYRVQYTFFAKTQGGKHYSRIIADIIKGSQTIQFHYVANLKGGRFLFIPERIDDKGLHGPPACKENYHCDFRYVIHGESEPWWRKQEGILCPILAEEEFQSLFEAHNAPAFSHQYLAEQLYVPPDILEKLSYSSNNGVRWSLAANPAISEDIVLRLMEDKEEFTRRRAKENFDSGRAVYNYLQERNHFRNK